MAYIKSRSLRLTVAAFAVTAMVVAVLAPAGADPLPPPAPEPFERVAFVARNDIPVDALAAGPIAGQLGAPVFVAGTNPPLNEFARQGLADFAPDLVIIAGGPAAISDAVRDEIADACDCPVERAAGQGRDETAQEIANLIEEFGFGRPLLTSTGSGQVVGDVFLGGTLAVDELEVEKPFTADSATTAGDADTLDGIDSTGFVPAEVSQPYIVQLALDTFVVLAEHGPLTVAAFCEDSGDGTPTMAVRVATSVDPSYNEDTGGSFGPTDGFIEIGDTSSPGTGEYINDIDEGTTIAEQDGTLYVVSVDGEIKGQGEDIFGQTCTMNGIVNAYTAPAGLTDGAEPVPAP